MEWVLQVADEFDDALGVLRHGWLGLVAEIGALSLAGLGIGAELADPCWAPSRRSWAPPRSSPISPRSSRSAARGEARNAPPAIVRVRKFR